MKCCLAKSLQSCLTLCDPIDSSPLGSPVPGILQARTMEWVAISFSNAWRWKEKVKSLSHAWLLATPWTAAYQAPPSMGFSRQEYWSGVPLPSPRKCSSFILLQVVDQFSQHHFLKRLSFLQYILASFVKDKVSTGAWIYLRAFYFAPLIYISVFVPVPYCLDIIL